MLSKSYPEQRPISTNSQPILGGTTKSQDSGLITATLPNKNDVSQRISTGIKEGLEEGLEDISKLVNLEVASDSGNIEILTEKSPSEQKKHVQKETEPNETQEVDESKGKENRDKQENLRMSVSPKKTEKEIEIEKILVSEKVEIDVGMLTPRVARYRENLPTTPVSPFASPVSQGCLSIPLIIFLCLSCRIFHIECQSLVQHVVLCSCSHTTRDTHVKGNYIFFLPSMLSLSF